MFNKKTYLLSILFSFALFFLICPNQVSAQTTVNFSLTILPAPEVKEEVIPEEVDKAEEKTAEIKQADNIEKQVESVPNDNQQTSGFGALLEENPGIEKKIEVISNTIDEKQTENIGRFEITFGPASENIRAGPS